MSALVYMPPVPYRLELWTLSGFGPSAAGAWVSSPVYFGRPALCAALKSYGADSRLARLYAGQGLAEGGALRPPWAWFQKIACWQGG